MCIELTSISRQVRAGYSYKVYKVVRITNEGQFVSPMNRKYIWLDPNHIFTDTKVFYPTGDVIVRLDCKKLEFSHGLLHAHLVRPVRGKNAGGSWLNSYSAILVMDINSYCIVDKESNTIAARSLVWDGKIVAMGSEASEYFYEHYNRQRRCLPKTIYDKKYKFKICTSW